MRIIGGILSGRKLVTETGTRMRPTSERAREALFSMLAWRLVGARVLDLFSGSGALGIEAISRGARQVVFVENHPAALGIIKENLRHCQIMDKSIVLRASAVDPGFYEGLIREGRGPFDLVLMDPPYGEGLEWGAMARLTGPGLLAPKALVVVERENLASGQDKEDALSGWEMDRFRNHGRARLEFWRRVAKEDGGE